MQFSIFWPKAKNVVFIPTKFFVTFSSSLKWTPSLFYLPKWKIPNPILSNSIKDLFSNLLRSISWYNRRLWAKTRTRTKIPQNSSRKHSKRMRLCESRASLLWILTFFFIFLNAASVRSGGYAIHKINQVVQCQKQLHEKIRLCGKLEQKLQITRLLGA